MQQNTYKPSKELLEQLKELGIQDPIYEIDWASYSTKQDISMKDWLKNEYGISLTNIKEQVEYVKAQQEKQSYELKKELITEERKILEKFKKEKGIQINIQAFDVFKKYLNTVINSNIHFLIGMGEGGLGKSFCAINSLKELLDNF